MKKSKVSTTKKKKPENISAVDSKVSENLENIPTNSTKEFITSQETLDTAVNEMNAQIIMDNILDSFDMPNLVEPSVTLIHEQNPFKKIELAGRTCYKSEDKITKDSSKEFYRMLLAKKHYAMIEHASVAFILDCNDGQEEELLDYIQFIMKHGFLNVTVEASIPRILVSGNVRSILERSVIDPIYTELISTYPELQSEEENLVDSSYYNIHARMVDLRKLKDLTHDEFLAHFYFTARFITDRGVSHELVRHRRFSFAQESTRYCNYSKSKFGGHVTYCKPTTYDSWTSDQQDTFNTFLSAADSVYNYLVNEGDNKLPPQYARAVLPNALKTEIVVSGPAYEWKHFFDLRSKGTTGAPHPDMKYVANVALLKINKYIKSLKFQEDLRF